MWVCRGGRSLLKTVGHRSERKGSEEAAPHRNDENKVGRVYILPLIKDGTLNSENPLVFIEKSAFSLFLVHFDYLRKNSPTKRVLIWNPFII